MERQDGRYKYGEIQACPDACGDHRCQPHQIERARLLRQSQREQHGGQSQRSHQANLHPAQGPIDQGIAEADQPRGGRAGQRAVVCQPRHDGSPQFRAEAQKNGTQDSHHQTGVAVGHIQPVRYRHEQRPQDVRDALHARAAGIPHQAVSAGQVARVGHRDHRIVEQRKDAPSVRDAR